MLIEVWCRVKVGQLYLAKKKDRSYYLTKDRRKAVIELFNRVDSLFVYLNVVNPLPYKREYYFGGWLGENEWKRGK